MSAFSTLDKDTIGGPAFEDPLMTDLHRCLVLNGDFSSAEEILVQAGTRGLFSEYITEFAYTPLWRRISALATPAAGSTPAMRGGHQMCIDTVDGRIFLFGGWDGTKDLCDFWIYDLKTEDWACVSMDTRRQGGPGPRSCHKICFDPKQKVRQSGLMGDRLSIC